MGAKTSIFNICKKSEIKVSLIDRPFKLPGAQTSGPVADIIVSPGGYQYFSRSEEKELSIKYNAQSPKVVVEPPSRFKTSDLIGQGSFGSVLLAVNLISGELMAVKHIPLIECTYEQGESRIKEIESEVKILKKLNHKNIVRYLGTKRDSQHLMIFMEYVAGGSISGLIQKYGKFNETLIRLYALQILEGLEYLHYHRIIHRDIKGANVLVGNDGTCKLADFGSARKTLHIQDRSQAKSLKGTTNWMAPEVMQQEGYGRFADVWSFGCLLVEMATGKPPWYYKSNQIAVFMHVCTTQELPQLPSELSEVAKDFILSCFKRKPSDRPSVFKLLRHPFIKTAFNSSFGSTSAKCEDTYVSVSTKFSTMEIKGKAKVSASNILSQSIVSLANADVENSISNFDKLDPLHAIKAPFSDIISADKPEQKVLDDNPDDVIILNRPSDEGSEY